MGWITRWRLSPGRKLPIRLSEYVGYMLVDHTVSVHSLSKSSVCGMTCCVSCSQAYQAERHFVWPLMKYSLFVHCAAWKYEFNIISTGDNQLPSLPLLPSLSVSLVPRQTMSFIFSHMCEPFIHCRRSCCYCCCCSWHIVSVPRSLLGARLKCLLISSRANSDMCCP